MRYPISSYERGTFQIAQLIMNYSKTKNTKIYIAGPTNKIVLSTLSKKQFTGTISFFKYNLPTYILEPII